MSLITKYVSFFSLHSLGYEIQKALRLEYQAQIIKFNLYP